MTETNNNTAFIEPIEGLLIEVHIVEEAMPYGKKRYKIVPVAGKVTKPKGVWIEKIIKK